MQPLTSADPETRSADLVAENIEQLKSQFPEAVVEGKIDFDVLRQLLGGAVDEREEKYGLNWHGKRRARQLALTPSLGTLRPCPEESINWDKTQNLMIEGDNLEVLKLLQKSYAGKVKLIYIDPPYNTGGDLVYPDDFKDNIANYLMLTGQTTSDGRKLTSNTESSGRFHTDWLNAIYPRLKVAKSLLRNDGVVAISIDDGELPGLRLVANEVFGEENFIACLVWKSRQNKDNRTTNGASIDHEYILCYGNSIRGASRDQSQYSNPDNDPRGEWASANMVGLATADQRPNLHYDLIDPKTNINYGCPDMGWRYDPNTMSRLIDEGRILWPATADGRPRRKAFLNELESDFTGYSTLVGQGVYTKDGTADVDSLFDLRIFSFPKPVKLIASLVEQGASKDDIVLDFYAGSGTTAHAVMAQNCCDRFARRYILVQLPECLDPANRDQKTPADYCDKLKKPRNIAELTKERVRRAGKKISEENPLFKGDVGFRVFKLASSNIRAWEPDRDNLTRTIDQYVEHLKADRTEQDILFELLLKLGLDLCVAIEQRAIGGKTVHSIGAGTLIVCLAPAIVREEVESLALGIVAWHKEQAPAGETTIVFRDSAFADDVAKTNLTAILHQHGLETVRSL
jgi:adenine-specific DNA-methyltransferase